MLQIYEFFFISQAQYVSLFSFFVSKCVYFALYMLNWLIFVYMFFSLFMSKYDVFIPGLLAFYRKIHIFL